MQKIFDILYYGGISPEEFRAIRKDIHESNRKNVIIYSTISLIGFIAVCLYAALGRNAVTHNMAFYLAGIATMSLLILLNRTLARKKPAVTHITAYLFIIILLGIGILLAANSREDVTASFMVFLFAAPLLVTIRPLYIDLVILGCDTVYILLMLQIQEQEVFRKNIVNACIYGVLSIFVCTTMTRMRLEKIHADHVNRILTETDQLTGMLNRRSFVQHIQELRAAGNVAGIKVCAFDVNSLKRVNDSIGHHAGDELLQGAAACLENVFSPYGSCYRIGGDEFAAILQDASPSVEELQSALDEQILAFKGSYVSSLSISTGIVEGSGQESIDSLLRLADTRMYENKAAYYRSQNALPPR